MSPGIGDLPVPQSALAFVQQVLRIGSFRAKGAPATSLPAAGARSLSRVLLELPAIADGAQPDTPLALFGATDDPRLQALRSESVGFVVAGALALGMTGHDVEALAPRLVYAGVEIDPTSLLLRQRLVGGKPFGPPAPVLPGWVEQLAEFARSDCFAGVVGAVLDLGTWAGQTSVSDATGIALLSPTSVCPGVALTISGSGFGATQPADTKVYVPTANGCRAATVNAWSDTAIVVQLPADVGAGCVGFVRGAGGQLGEPQRVTGELTTCIGAAAEAWTRGFGKVGKAALVSCPPCLPGGQNRIQAGGRPVVSTFRFTPAHVEPGGQPVLSWSVTNATSLQIAGVGGNGPVLALPSPLPPVGSITLAPVGGLAPVTGHYRLTAINACGAATADGGFAMSRTPQLAVGHIEVVQSTQKVDNSVPLTANRSTAVRVFVESGISDGFDLGSGANRVPGLTASLQAESLVDGSLTSCGTPWPTGSDATPGPNRDLLADSFNFDVPLAACQGPVRFHAFVELPAGAGQPPLSSASGTVDVVFAPKRPQEFLPLLISDPSSTSPAPTIADFFTNLTGPGGPAREQPFPEDGFLINPPLAMTLGATDSLKSGLNWSLLVARIATTIYLFPSTPVGGIRAGVVPMDPAYPWWGMALPRIAITAPSYISVRTQPQTCAHELGHAFGLLHVNCGSPAGPYDANLPLTMSDPGLDVRERSIVAAGSNELMTYCDPQWVSVEHWDLLFNSIPI